MRVGGGTDLKRKATEHGVAAIWQDARESLDYSVRTDYTKAGITYLQRTTTLPDGARVRGSHCVTIGEPPGKSGSRSKIRITFYPAAVDLGYEEFGQFGDAIPFEGGKPRNVLAMRCATDQWYCRRGGGETRAAIAVAVAVPRWAAASGDRRGRRLTWVTRRWAGRGGLWPRGAASRSAGG
ncbi:MAG: hypothetical protein F4Y24_08810 [Gemmatimonadetes bacterium]|nr:hypothetical protein [Gemmatimonadota bacterium]MYG22654.1 hypothetical protein [Gemmatimonadota bacterium]MYJ39145.1 hypothetical protein [Gemmatimonadota bacterium]